jgi:hypothetical protein
VQNSQTTSAPEPQPFIVTLAKTPTKETTLQDVVLGALGLAGSLLLLAIVLGVVVSLVRLAWLRRHPPEEEHLPSVSPFAAEATAPRSSRSR